MATSLRPTFCGQCQEEFMRRPLLQAEARHVAATAGESVAASAVDEALQGYHDGGH